jgi:hypothetical protein
VRVAGSLTGPPVVPHVGCITPGAIGDRGTGSCAIRQGGRDHGRRARFARRLPAALRGGGQGTPARGSRRPDPVRTAPVPRGRKPDEIAVRPSRLFSRARGTAAGARIPKTADRGSAPRGDGRKPATHWLSRRRRWMAVTRDDRNPLDEFPVTVFDMSRHRPGPQARLLLLAGEDPGVSREVWPGPPGPATYASMQRGDVRCPPMPEFSADPKKQTTGVLS